MNYKNKYLKYKNRYLKLKSNLSLDKKGGAALVPDAEPKGIVFIFVPNGFDGNGWYSDLLHYYELYSKLKYFAGDRVYILGPLNLASSQAISRQRISSDHFMSHITMEATLKTPSLGSDLGVNRRIGLFDDSGIEEVYAKIFFHNPDIIHFHFLTHGYADGLGIVTNSERMDIDNFINKLIINDNINKFGRKLFIHTDSCYGGNYIKNIYDKLKREEFGNLNIELFLTADTINKTSSNVHMSNMTSKSVGYFYETTILSALTSNQDITFNEMFGNNGMLYNIGGKLMLRRVFEIELTDIIRQIQKGMSIDQYQIIKNQKLELLASTFVYLYKNWSTIKIFDKNFMIILCYLPPDVANFNDKIEEMITISKTFRPSYRQILIQDRETITHIINYKDTLAGAGVSEIINAYLEYNTLRFRQNLMDLIIRVITSENNIAYNQLSIPDELISTPIVDLFGGLKELKEEGEPENMEATMVEEKMQGKK